MVRDTYVLGGGKDGAKTLIRTRHYVLVATGMHICAIKRSVMSADLKLTRIGESRRNIVEAIMEDATGCHGGPS